MDTATLSRYRELIKRVITGHAQINPLSGDIRVETVFDETQDHYALVESGWDGLRRIEGQVIHIDIINGKIWIQHDGTEYGVARELEDLGVSRQEIVLGFHSPMKRPLTDYAAG
jgi:hypothetical protein